MNHPLHRSEFPNIGQELHHISDVIQAGKAKKEPLDEDLVARFELLLQACGLDDGSIMLQEFWATLHEIKGDFEKAIFHRKRQVQLVEQLFAMGGPVGPIDDKYLASILRSLADSLMTTRRDEEAAQARNRAEELDS